MKDLWLTTRRTNSKTITRQVVYRNWLIFPGAITNPSKILKSDELSVTAFSEERPK
jgi:hypothetical protein